MIADLQACFWSRQLEQANPSDLRHLHASRQLTPPSNRHIVSLVPMYWQIEQRDFRCSYPYAATNAHGKTVMLRLCEELVEGSWEEFISMCSRIPARPCLSKLADCGPTST